MTVSDSEPSGFVRFAVTAGFTLVADAWPASGEWV
jgi:hypothetical protein